MGGRNTKFCLQVWGCNCLQHARNELDINTCMSGYMCPLSVVRELRNIMRCYLTLGHVPRNELPSVLAMACASGSCLSCYRKYLLRSDTGSIELWCFLTAFYISIHSLIVTLYTVTSIPFQQGARFSQWLFFPDIAILFLFPCAHFARVGKRADLMTWSIESSHCWYVNSSTNVHCTQYKNS